MPAAAPPLVLNVTALLTFVAVAALPPIDRLDAVPVRPVPAPLNDVEVKTPVDGTYCSLVELTVAGLLPVLLAENTGYQVDADEVLSVIATLVAFVAVVAVDAEPAEPSIFVPVRVWLALARLSAIAVVPM